MTKHLLGALALLTLTGCHPQNTKTGLRFSITPDSAAQTITVSCKESSSNTCHFAFTGRISPAETAVKAGESIVLIGDASNTLYCAEPTKPTIGNCRATSIAPKRQVITKETSTDESQ